MADKQALTAAGIDAEHHDEAAKLVDLGASIGDILAIIQLIRQFAGPVNAILAELSQFAKDSHTVTEWIAEVVKLLQMLPVKQ